MPQWPMPRRRPRGPLWSKTDESTAGGENNAVIAALSIVTLRSSVASSVERTEYTPRIATDYRRETTKWPSLRRVNQHRGRQLVCPRPHRWLVHRQRLADTTVASGCHPSRSTGTWIESSVIGTCTVDGKQTTCTFLAMELMGHEIILGMDILEQLGLQLTLNGQPTSPTMTTGGRNVCTVGVSDLTIGERMSIVDFITEEKKCSTASSVLLIWRPIELD